MAKPYAYATHIEMLAVEQIYDMDIQHFMLPIITYPARSLPNSTPVIYHSTSKASIIAHYSINTYSTTLAVKTPEAALIMTLPPCHRAIWCRNAFIITTRQGSMFELYQY